MIYSCISVLCNAFKFYNQLENLYLGNYILNFGNANIFMLYTVLNVVRSMSMHNTVQSPI